MTKKYLELVNFNDIENLRRNFNADLALQAIDDRLKADLRLEFENWLNNWASERYRQGTNIPGSSAELPTQQIVIAPATIPLNVSYGSINLAANGNILWANGNSTIEYGTVAEVFVDSGKVWGRTVINEFYSSPDTEPFFQKFSDITGFKAARLAASKIIQIANCPPLPY